VHYSAFIFPRGLFSLLAKPVKIQSMKSRKVSPPGERWSVMSFFGAHFFAFCFGLAVVLASVVLLRAQRPD
jgi:hypothetical protein